MSQVHCAMRIVHCHNAPLKPRETRSRMSSATVVVSSGLDGRSGRSFSWRGSFFFARGGGVVSAIVSTGADTAAAMLSRRAAAMLSAMACRRFSRAINSSSDISIASRRRAGSSLISGATAISLPPSAGVTIFSSAGGVFCFVFFCFFFLSGELPVAANVMPSTRPDA